MTISIDRESGLFTPELSDRINTMSTNLWENIQELSVPEKAYKETVAPFKIQTTAESRQSNFSIGRVHIISLVVTGTVTANGFQKFADLPFSPSTDVIVLNGTNSALFKIEAGTNTLFIDTFGATISGFDCFFWFIS